MSVHNTPPPSRLLEFKSNTTLEKSVVKVECALKETLGPSIEIVTKTQSQPLSPEWVVINEAKCLANIPDYNIWGYGQQSISVELGRVRSFEQSLLSLTWGANMSPFVRKTLWHFAKKSSEYVVGRVRISYNPSMQNADMISALTELGFSFERELV